MAKKTRTQLETELKILRSHGIGNNITKIVRDFFKWGSICLIGLFVWLSIDSLAGKTTMANIDVKAKGEVSVNKPEKAPKTDKEMAVLSEAELYAYKILLLLALGFGVGGILYGRAHAKLRKDVIERYHPLKQKAEENVDPKRSTSRLTQRGDTRPEDV